MSRELWKPLLVVVVAAVLVGLGLQIDPDQPKCGPTPMTPQMVCATEGRGGAEQRTYQQMVAEARAWQTGLPVAGGVLAIAGVSWVAVLVRRRNAPAEPVSPWTANLAPASPITPIRPGPGLPPGV